MKDDAVVLARKDAGMSIETESVTSAEAAPRGYFVIRARDLDEAIAIAQDCPHLKHGGRISLRPIDKVQRALAVSRRVRRQIPVATVGPADLDLVSLGAPVSGVLRSLGSS